MYMLAQLLTSRSHWTVADVMSAVDGKLAAAGYTVPAVIERGVAYLRWLLSGTDPAAPPAQLAHAVAEAEGVAARERITQRRAEHAAQAAAAAPSDSPARLAALARAALAGALSRRGGDRRGAARLAAAHAAHAARSPDTCLAGHALPAPHAPCGTCAAWLDGPALDVSKEQDPPSPRWRESTR